ncbi:STAS domain protein [Leptospira inadai serovar Lyme str. 10]|uniref:STAS domain protein n=2 Tax=Leptospira inadai serovar Lyme TaxID=293084 RepID=V6H9F4_9LEPT|nr:STAS domain-containing protein [Leptospira inadai]EQA35771.1 STAS domain protein [Leptospira inadai serovar Lyme str. 10]PNV76877.1 STAS domain protein [Leptospira inadai serovar Lyme]
MKELIVNLQGKLDSVLGTSFQEKIEQVLSSEIHRILLDAGGLTAWDQEGLILLKNSVTNHPQSKFSVCFLPTALVEDWKKLGLDVLIPFFSTREEAKAFLLQDKKKEIEEGMVACPICFRFLRVKGQGNYRCPACSHIFYLTSDYRTATFEKLF